MLAPGLYIRMFSTNTQQKQWFIRKQKTKYIKDIKCIQYSNHAIPPCFKLREEKKKKKDPCHYFFHLQHFPSSKISLNILKMTCWKQTQYRERFESLPGKPPCTIAVPACTSRYLHSWQTFSAVSSSNPHHTQAQCCLSSDDLGPIFLRFFSP